jgi:hypothetical protein
MSKTGFKTITPENWQESDILRYIPKMTEEIWLRTHLEPKLADTVPDEIHSLFEAARGAMIYGWFYYPLLTLGSDQLFRTLEAAVHHCCLKRNIPVEFADKNGKTRSVKYADQVRRLVEKGVIPVEEESRWEGARGLRNVFAHPKSQMVLSPGMTVDDLYMIASEINRLFDDKKQNSAKP